MNETTTKKFEPQKRCFSQNLSIKFYAIPGNRAAKKTKVYLIPVLTNHAQKKNLYCRKVLQNCEKSPTSLTHSHHATLWTTKSDCNLPIAHQAIVHQQVFNNHAIPQVSEAQKRRKFQSRQSRGSDTGAINQLNSRLENVNPGYNSLRVLSFINQIQPKNVTN